MDMFDEFLSEIVRVAGKLSDKTFSFVHASKELEKYVNDIDDIKPIVAAIGVIPESIVHDSTEEKLFAKASDAVLSRAFIELGLKSVVLAERGNAADVVAKSKYHDYSLVADAKAFRMSRTAKNQKDFKVESLDVWRVDNNYAVLASPYFQYPRKESQIYKQAVEHNVLLFTWEHILLMLENEIKETPDFSLETIWNWSSGYAGTVSVANSNKNFIKEFNEFFLDVFHLSMDQFKDSLINDIALLKQRGDSGKHFWQGKIQEIQSMTREEAITELLIEKKIGSKIVTIDKYIGGLNADRYTV